LSSDLAPILDRLAAVLGTPDGDPTPLDGGITNRNYLVTMDGERYVVRLPGKDTGLLLIDRSAELEANKAAAALGIAPPVAAMLHEPPCIVTRFLDGRVMEAAELREPVALAEVATALRAFHDSGLTLPAVFDSFQIPIDYAATARERGVEPPDRYLEAMEHAAQIRAVLRGHEHMRVPCHNDLLAANFIRAGRGVRIVDWEYAGMGDRYFDLGNFAVNNELSEDQAALLLGAYWREPATPSRQASLRLMRFMSDLREAMWGVVQSAVSDLDFDFTGYAAQHFERLHRTAADPRFAESLEEARAVA
jgi:thiamine kinase-like enzyme